MPSIPIDWGAADASLMPKAKPASRPPPQPPAAPISAAARCGDGTHGRASACRLCSLGYCDGVARAARLWQCFPVWPPAGGNDIAAAGGDKRTA
eukprot:2054970-Prymnesium_polylepis.2